jgi:hypothetical protein
MTCCPGIGVVKASLPNRLNDRKRWLDQFVHLMGHTGSRVHGNPEASIKAQRPRAAALELAL